MRPMIMSVLLLLGMACGAYAQGPPVMEIPEIPAPAPVASAPEIVVKEGPRGPAGPKGDRGPQGPRGLTGRSGGYSRWSHSSRGVRRAAVVPSWIPAQVRQLAKVNAQQNDRLDAHDRAIWNQGQVNRDQDRSIWNTKERVRRIEEKLGIGPTTPSTDAHDGDPMDGGGDQPAGTPDNPATPQLSTPEERGQGRTSSLAEPQPLARDEFGVVLAQSDRDKDTKDEGKPAKPEIFVFEDIEGKKVPVPGVSVVVCAITGNGIPAVKTSAASGIVNADGLTPNALYIVSPRGDGTYTPTPESARKTISWESGRVEVEMRRTSDAFVSPEQLEQKLGSALGSMPDDANTAAKAAMGADENSRIAATAVRKGPAFPWWGWLFAAGLVLLGIVAVLIWGKVQNIGDNQNTIAGQVRVLHDNLPKYAPNIQTATEEFKAALAEARATFRTGGGT